MNRPSPFVLLPKAVSAFEKEGSAMKKWLAFVLAAAVLCCAGSAPAEKEEGFSFAEITDLEFLFSSGTGGWHTLLRIDENGALTGDFHDSEMGDTGEAYPDGSVYVCPFHGQLSIVEQVDSFTWKLRLVSLESDELPANEWIEDGIRYIAGTPYGLEDTDELLLYLPGMPIGSLPEGFLPWSHLWDLGEDPETLPYYALYNAQGEYGFVGEAAYIPTE